MVVDTGSTDKTISIVRGIESDKLTLRNIKWVDNFALMRNRCLKFLHGNWVIYIDSDEEFKKLQYSGQLKVLIALSELLESV
ncbi:glycosyltransferase [Pediococcus siamensis]|uniref:glycosyltransferase n=1 Tax=Pediococcus siamensis TaxID=381829 RepID=UPI0039A39B63